MNHPSHYEHCLAHLEHQKKKADVMRARFKAWKEFFAMITTAASMVVTAAAAVAALTPASSTAP